MKLTGHKTETVYRRYTIVSESDLFEAVRKLETRPVGFQLVSNPGSDAPAGEGTTEQNPL